MIHAFKSGCTSERLTGRTIERGGESIKQPDRIIINMEGRVYNLSLEETQAFVIAVGMSLGEYVPYPD